jgi:hypothetical protein
MSCKISILDASSVLSCFQLAQSISPNAILTVSFAGAESFFVTMDSCCVVRVGFDPLVVLVTHGTARLSMNVSKWISIVSIAVKSKSTVLLEPKDGDALNALMSDGTTVSATQDVDDAADDVANVDSLFASIQTSADQRLAIGFPTTSELVGHLAPFTDFKSVSFRVKETTGPSTSVVLVGVEHVKSLKCTRTIHNVLAMQPISASDATLINGLSFNVMYLTKLISMSNGKKCALRIAHSSMSDSHVLACRYTVDATPAKRKDSDQRTHRVSCVLSPIVEEDS